MFRGLRFRVGLWLKVSEALQPGILSFPVLGTWTATTTNTATSTVATTASHTFGSLR